VLGLSLFKNKKIVSRLKLLLGLLLLVALLVWNDNGKQLLEIFSGFNPQFIFVLFLIAFALNIVSSAKWALFIRDHGVKISEFRVFSLYLIGKFFSNFLPSMIGGDVARAYMLGQEINSHSRSLASVFLERATGLIALAALASIFSLINYPILVNPMISITIGVAFFSCLLFSVVFLKASVKSSFLKVIDRLPLVKKYSTKFALLFDEVGYYKGRKKLLVLSMGYSFLFHLLAGVNVYAACWSIGFTPDFLDILVITPVVLLLTMIPVSPNNIGWWEWCFGVLLVSAGASTAEGLAVALTLRAVTLVVSLFGGLLFLYYKDKKLTKAP